MSAEIVKATAADLTRLTRRQTLGSLTGIIAAGVAPQIALGAYASGRGLLAARTAAMAGGGGSSPSANPYQTSDDAGILMLDGTMSPKEIVDCFGKKKITNVGDIVPVDGAIDFTGGNAKYIEISDVADIVAAVNQNACSVEIVTNFTSNDMCFSIYDSSSVSLSVGQRLSSYRSTSSSFIEMTTGSMAKVRFLGNLLYEGSSLKKTFTGKLTIGEAVFRIGKIASSYKHMCVYSIRFYSRLLTADEMSAFDAEDARRFGLT